METSSNEQPRRVSELRSLITKAAESRHTTVKVTQSLVANVIVGQMLPSSVVKGGTMLKLRFGDSVTRETPDLDTALRGDFQQFKLDLDVELANGWKDFTGSIVEGGQRGPDAVPAAYLMHPLAIKLKYRNKSFCTVDMEVGYDELAVTSDLPHEAKMSEEIVSLFAELNLPQPDPIPVLPLPHQIAQKLHACSEPGSERAHDLIDIQLMAGDADDQEVAHAARRLFNFRRQQTWPPVVVAGVRWPTLYEQANSGVVNKKAHGDVAAAVTWVNDYIATLNTLP